MAKFSRALHKQHHSSESLERDEQQCAHHPHPPQSSVRFTEHSRAAFLRLSFPRSFCNTAHNSRQMNHSRLRSHVELLPCHVINFPAIAEQSPAGPMHYIILYARTIVSKDLELQWK